MNLALSSSLFSGGLDPTYFNMLSEDTKKVVIKFARFSKDLEILKHLNEDPPECKLEAVIVEGKSKEVDKTIKLL